MSAIRCFAVVLAAAAVAAGASGAVAVPLRSTCTKSAGFKSATALSVATAAPGLTVSTDPIYYYKVYGNTADQVRSQLNACSPVPRSSDQAEHDGYTSWSINWRFAYVQQYGSCKISFVAVRLHVNELLPTWRPSVKAAPGLRSKWDTYVRNLTTHEQGHVDLSRQYAQKILTDLRNFPPTGCSSIAAAANGVANADEAALKKANDDYDARTRHGATQGAAFP